MEIIKIIIETRWREYVIYTTPKEYEENGKDVFVSKLLDLYNYYCDAEYQLNFEEFVSQYGDDILIQKYNLMQAYDDDYHRPDSL